jgi:hypothetical protein
MKTWIAQYITSALLGSWKTTIVGFLAAFTVLVLPILQTGQIPTEQQWLLAFFAALAGLVCKDYNKAGTGSTGDPVRGGTPAQQREAVAKDVLNNAVDPNDPNGLNRI